ncbi:MAG TPA: NAD(P)-binding domain-containing protein [Chitinophagaceae bacterium]|nr:NAD(P)-binding domain-containing protein [Chitinophagaceae bacterium]
MRIGILGTGIVGETLGTALVKKGHQVKMGSRSAINDVAASWVAMNGENASQGTFADAARFGDIVMLCLNGDKAKDALQMAGPDGFAGKIVIDITNPLDFSRGMPPVLVPSLSNITSLGEQIQAYLPDAKVVKALNTVTAKLMVDASLVNGGDSTLPICGNDADAKEQVKRFLTEQFGWRNENILDLGDITASRNTEAYVPLWVRFWQAAGTPMFNIKIVQ